MNGNDTIAELAKIASELTGVQFTDRHRDMIQSRLQKRAMDLNLGGIDEYMAYFKANRQEESVKLIGMLTTHHTYFFREFSHFEFLLEKALPALLPELRSRPDKKLKIWSAACSRGQEIYSLAMYLDFHLKRLDPTLTYEILGTDVDPESVGVAKNGVYQRTELKEVPMTLLGDHWVRGSGEIENYVKAKSTLRSKCRFSTANLLELKSSGLGTEKFDLIFCRNVFIYFNHQQIQKITQDLLGHMSPKGYLFIGISESLSQLKLPVHSLGPSVYQHKAAADAEKAQTKAPAAPAAIGAKRPTLVSTPTASQPAIPARVRVLCVDDSPSVLVLLKKILSSDAGFEVVGTAENGIEAAKKLAELKPDAMTLDIHMPEMTGVEYLQKHFNSSHPPVVMITSVSRDNSDLAGKALTYGASDFVEKPALTNIAERGDEIRTKIRCALLAKQVSAKGSLALDQSFQKKTAISDPNSKLRIVSMTLSHRTAFRKMVTEFTATQPPCVIVVDGAKEALPAMAELLSKDTGKKVHASDQAPSNLSSGDYYLIDVGTIQSLWEKFGKDRQTSILVFGEASKGTSEKLMVFQGAQLVLEDLGGGKGSAQLKDVASDIVLPTSFAYLSNEYLSQGKKAA